MSQPNPSSLVFASIKRMRIGAIHYEARELPPEVQTYFQQLASHINGHFDPNARNQPVLLAKEE